MLYLKNRTTFSAMLLPAPDPDGIDSVYTVVKGTFTLGKRIAPAEAQVPVVLADTYAGEPGKSSLKAASDLGLVKPGTDVLLMGTAHAPGGRRVDQMDVSLRVGPVRKTVRIFGDRVWRAGVLASSPSPPEPFVNMSLVWERAFGGTDQSEGPSPQLEGEDRNPAGSGFRSGKGEKPIEGLRLPNLEDPRRLISSWRDRPAPVAFAPLCPHWEPRRTYAGTYDQQWMERRMPYLPKDFDNRFFQLAPPDLVAPGYLEGGEPVEIHGATPEGLSHFNLPRYRVQVVYRLDNVRRMRPAHLDAVLIEPDEKRLVLVWRASFSCDKKLLRVREVEPLVQRGDGEA